MIGACYPGLYAIDAYVSLPAGILAPRLDAVGVRGGLGDAHLTFSAPTLFAARGTTGAGSALTLRAPTIAAVAGWRGVAALTTPDVRLNSGAGLSTSGGRVDGVLWWVQALFANGWSSLPVLASVPVTWRLGMSGGTPQDRVAATGECQFSLRNDDHDGVPMGYYSPDAAQCRPGWTYGIAIRVVAYYAPYGYATMWTGVLHTVTPSPGRHRDRQVACVALDSMNALAETDARTIAPQINRTENDLIVAVLQSLPASVIPTVVYDASLDIYPYALDNAAENVLAMSLIADIVTSAQAYFYLLKSGIVRVENREARANAQPVCVFTDDSLVALEVPTDLANVFNDVRVVIHPRTFSPQPVVLYAITTAPAIAPQARLELWGDYRDPTNDLQLVGGINAIAPVGGVDYRGNSAPDGSGVDLTAWISVTADAFAASVKFTVVNTHTSYTAYLVDAAGEGALQMRGTAVYDVEALTYTAQSAQSYGAQVLSLDLRYQHDGWKAQELADRLLAQYQRHDEQIVALSFDPHRNATLMLQALTGEVGQVVEVSESVTGVARVLVAIQGIECTLTAARWLSVRYLTAPKPPPLPAPLPSSCTYTGPTSGAVTPGQALLFSQPGVWTLQFTQPARVAFYGAAAGASGSAPDSVGNGGGGGGTGAYEMSGTAFDVRPHAFYLVTIGAAGAYPNHAGGDARVEQADETARYLHLEGGQVTSGVQGGAGGRVLLAQHGHAGIKGGDAGRPGTDGVVTTPPAGGPFPGADDGFSGSGGGAGHANWGGAPTWGREGGRNGAQGAQPPRLGYPDGDGGGCGGRGGMSSWGYYAYGGGGGGGKNHLGQELSPGSAGGPAFLVMYW